MIWLLFPAVLYGLFLGPLITGSQAFLGGDYFDQFYPWSRYFFERWSAGEWPLWNPLNQAGLPLFAEGQTATLYLPTLVLYKIFPFDIAYNLFFLLHFLFALVFFWMFVRKRGVSHFGSVVAVLAFGFGSAYAGCFYGIYSLRPLLWFPAVLYLTERYLEKGDKRFAALMAFALGESALAGYPQMAAYGFVFGGLYFVLRFSETRGWRTLWGRDGMVYLSAIVIALLIACPQLWATWEAAAASTRTLQDKTFVFWGSLPPAAFLILFFPSLGIFFKSKWYIGVVPLLFMTGTPHRKFRTEWILIILGVLLAMGMYSPLSWPILWTPGASLLRNPSKTLYFSIFFMSFLAGVGTDNRKNIFGRAAKLTAFFAALLAAAMLLAHAGKAWLMQFGEWYVRTFVLEKSFHRKPPEYYLGRISDLADFLAVRLSPTDVWLWLSLALAFVFLAVVALQDRGKLKLTAARVAFMALICMDLFLFSRGGSGAGFTGNMEPLPKQIQTEAFPRDGRWLDLMPADSKYFLANRNLLSGHAFLGVYTPIANLNYFELMRDSSAVDDGFGPGVADPEFANVHRPLVDFLETRYVVVPSGADMEGFDPVSKNGTASVWSNPRAEVIAETGRWVPAAKILTQAEERVQFLRGPEWEPREQVVLEDAALAGKEGFWVRPVLYDPGWKARLNGQEIPVLRANHAFQAVQIPQNASGLSWSFEPTYWTVGCWIHLLGLLLALVCLSRKP